MTLDPWGGLTKGQLHSARNNSNNSNMSSYLNWFEGLEMEFEFELIYLFELIDVETTPVHYNNLINILSPATF